MSTRTKTPRARKVPAGGITEPGHYDIDEDAYHADPVVGGSLSSTGAKTLAKRTPAHFAYERVHGRPAKREFDFGRAAHMIVTGSGAPIVDVAADDWRSRAAKEAAEEARAMGATPLLTKDVEKVEAMADALRAHDVAGPLFMRKGRPEQSFVARDPESGVMCRVRLDWMPDVGPGERVVAVDYKGLALDTEIPTPDGWTTMAALGVGDQVLDSAGRPCTVTGKSEVHWRTCYRLRFDDGSAVICDDEHRWATSVVVSSSRREAAPQVRTTRDILATLRKYGRHHHQVAVAGPLELDEAMLPVDPYVLGVWIGDGTASSGRVTSADGELWDLIRERGYSVGEHAPTDAYTRTVYGLGKQLRLAGYLGHKAIPSPYLRASMEQRAALLRGLMDTDGSWNVTRHQAIYTSVDKGLAEQVRELALSLGQRATVSPYRATGFGHTVTAYRVQFTPMGGLIPFALSRKAERVGSYPRAESRRRLIVGVEHVPTVATQCITVDSLDSTYLCTEAMIPTHNTAADADPATFGTSVARYGYDQQDPFYRDVLHWLGLTAGPDGELVEPLFVFVAQEKDPPYLVSVDRIKPEDRDRGRVLNRYARDRFRACLETGTWPGYEPIVHDLELPGWHRHQLDAAIAAGRYDTASDMEEPDDD